MVEHLAQITTIERLNPAAATGIEPMARGDRKCQEMKDNSLCLAFSLPHWHRLCRSGSGKIQALNFSNKS